MTKMFGVRLDVELIKRMKKHVKEVKQFRLYSSGELVRESVENFLKEVEKNDRKN